MAVLFTFKNLLHFVSQEEGRGSFPELTAIKTTSQEISLHYFHLGEEFLTQT